MALSSVQAAGQRKRSACDCEALGGETAEVCGTMTTVAYDGRYLAADMAAWQGSIFSSRMKITRIESRKGWYVGCGRSGVIIKLTRWLETGERDEIPADELEKSGGLFVSDVHECFFIDPTFELVSVNRGILADGAGCQVALGAMHAGATAMEAIRITERCSDAARGLSWVEVGVDTDVQQAPSC